ncbi:MAG: putative zinc-binding protein [Candidatus Jordarchaeales archaeon]
MNESLLRRAALRRLLPPREREKNGEGMALKVVVQSCCGPEKVYGLVARMAARLLAEQLRPDKVLFVCLPRLAHGDEETKKLVEENPCITIDGCVNRCAKNIVEQAGGKPMVSITVVDVLKENRHLMPRAQQLMKLDEKGVKLAEKVAERLAVEVDYLLGE